MKNRKLVSIILSMATVAMLLTGCDSSNSSNTSSKTTTSTTTTSKTSTSKTSSSSSSSDSKGTKKTCIACHGLGEVEQYYTNDPLEAPHWETCALCKGKGYYYE